MAGMNRHSSFAYLLPCCASVYVAGPTADTTPFALSLQELLDIEMNWVSKQAEPLFIQHPIQPGLFGKLTVEF